MSELPFLVLDYALQHLLASSLIALVALLLCRTTALSPAARARVLAGALMLCVLGSALFLTQRPGAAAVAVSATASASADSDVPAKATWLPRSIAISQSTATLLVALWFAGVTWQLGRRAKAYLGLHRLIATSVRSRRLERDYRQMLPKGVAIHLCASFGPAVAGTLRPKILLPEQLAAALPDEALRAVLLHEIAHIRRHDPLAHALQKIAEALFWWNPLMRRLGAALDTVREIACDVEASRSCDTPTDYADALLTAIEHLVPLREARLVATLGVSDALQALDQRISGIIEERPKPGPAATFAWVVALLPMYAACMAVAAVAPALTRTMAVTAAAGPATTDVAAGPVTAAAAEPATTAATETTSGLSGDHYQRSAARASHDYDLGATAASIGYQRRVAQLDGIVSSDVYDERLSQIRQDYDEAMSATQARYTQAITRAAERFESARQPGDAGASPLQE